MINKQTHGEDALLAKLKMPTLLLALSAFCNLQCPYCSRSHERTSTFGEDVFTVAA